MTFNRFAERETNAAVESIMTGVADVLQRELDGLRAEFDARLAALRTAPTQPEQSSLIKRLVEDLSGTAAREAEEAAIRARHDAEQAANLQLAAVRADAQTQLEQERANLEQERANIEALGRTIEELRKQIEEITSAAQAEVQGVRAELTVALDEARNEREKLSASLAASQRDAAAARDDLQERTARLEMTEQRLQAVEEAHEQLQQTVVATEARLASEVRDRTDLANSLQAAQQAALKASAEADASRAELHADNEALRRTIEELQSQAQVMTGAAEAELQSVRAELTAALVEAQNEQARLAASLGAALEDAAGTRHDMQERTAWLDATEQRLQAAEDARERLQQALAVSEAQLAAEARGRTALAESLQAAEQATITARAEAEASRTELDAANSRFHTLQRQTPAQRLDPALLIRLRCSLRAFTGLSRTRDVLDTFLDQFGREFDRVALFAVRENRLEGWRSIGFEPTTDVRNLIIPLTMESPLARAASDAKSTMVDSDCGNPRTGLLGHDTYWAMAVPIFRQQRVVAVAYAEMAQEPSEETRLVDLQVAEILAEQVTQSFTNLPDEVPTIDVESEIAPVAGTIKVAAPHSAATPTTAEPSYPGPPRAAERLRLPDALEVIVDGGAAMLVDISSLGAQIVCSKVVRPNHQVRMSLQQNGENVLCCGRVVWALFEMMPGGGRYRAGLNFTSVDTVAVEAFLNQQIAKQHRTSA